MDSNKVLIGDDLFGIAKRLKRIDDGYFLVYNRATKKYEVHNSKNIGNTLSLVSPFETLDIRLVHLVRKTRVERSVELIKEMDEQNERLEKSKNAEIKDNANERLKDALRKYRKESC